VQQSVYAIIILVDI